MKKWLCILLIFAFLAALLPAPALAEGNGEENGVYDPFAPENLDQGAAPEERHTYDDSSASMFRSYSMSASSDPRYVNVLLSQNDHTSATVCFTGNYALCDAADTPLFRVESDYTYTISVNGTNLELRDATGAVLYSGTGFYFKEYAPPAGLDYNYFKVAQVANVSLASDRIYKGELNCYYKAKSGSYADLWTGLYLINCIYIEEYLKGVLPAEIGSGRPTAALQAQAVVARNYAVRSKRTDGRIFDVYDYNLSQAYYGLYCFADTDATVNATAGQVLTYGGTAIRAYYCNTNGGYTEISTNEWTGEGQSGPESVRPDPYDLLATAYVEEVTIPANPTGSNVYVTSLITNALVPALQATYPGVTASQITVASLSIAQGACYDASCRHHDGTDQTQICTHFCSIDVTFSGIIVTVNTLGQPVDPVTVNIRDTDLYVSGSYGFFSQTRLSHYWLIENKDGETVVSYTIRHARHGSGVGLSQQGAIQRANAGQTMAQILDFYFPGCAVQTYSALGAADTLADISAVTFSSTYEALGHDAYVYAKTNLNSLIRGVLDADACVQVASSNDTWIKIAYGGDYGYILKTALERTFTKVAITNVVSSIDIRSAADPNASSLGKAYPGNTFTLLDDSASGNYHKISFNGQTGYISSRYSKLLTAAAAGDETGISTYTVGVTIPTGYTDTVLWVDGVPYQGTVSNGTLTATVYSNTATNAVMYFYNEADTPKGMSVWLLAFANGVYSATKVDGFTDLLSYHGFSARITGESGIRFKSGIAQTTRTTLTTTGIAGYKLVEYGTVCFQYPQYYGSYPFIVCDNGEVPTGYGKSYWTQNNTTYDFVAETVDGRVRFASVRVGIDDENLATEFIFRAYIKLNNGTKTIILYGAPMSRSIYTIAKYYMDRGDYTDDSEEGIFLNRIIDYVESND